MPRSIVHVDVDEYRPEICRRVRCAADDGSGRVGQFPGGVDTVEGQGRLGAVCTDEVDVCEFGDGVGEGKVGNDGGA